jgi:FtsP/CotA-like multicopper oxidase with cupredoxin domain
MYELRLSSGAPLIQIATDGGLLPKAMAKPVLELSPAERGDVVIDFAAYPPGTQIILKNCADCAPSLASVMRFDVELPATEEAALPDCLSSWDDLPVSAQTVTRQFLLNRVTTAEGAVWTINNQIYALSNPPLATVKHGAIETWKFLNQTGHRHPMHIHLVQFQVLDINGVAQDPSTHGWKDTFVAPPSGQITVAARFSGYTGKYLFHCHNLEHEDLGMMAEFEITS